MILGITIVGLMVYWSRPHPHEERNPAHRLSIALYEPA